MKSAIWPGLAILLVIFAAGCSSRNNATASTGGTTANAASPAEDATGTGHITLTGEYPFESDFTVERCQVGPPGDGLLSGYRMGSKADGKPIGLLTVTLKDYAKDGAYVEAAPSSGAAASETMSTGNLGALALMIMRETAQPLAFGAVASSKLTMTISGDGSKGDAEFSDLESQISLDDIDLKSGARPHGKRVSGSLTWTCGSVARIAANLNDAINGSFKALVPPK